jgi:hypothetical protein
MVILLVSTKSKLSGALTIFEEILGEINRDNSIILKVLTASDLNVKYISQLEVFRLKTSCNFIVNFVSKVRLTNYIIKTYKVDYLLSLENYISYRYRVRTGVLIHNSLPLMNDVRILGLRMFIKSRLLGIIYKFFNSNADDVFVQLNWFKDELIERLNITSKVAKTVYFNSSMGNFITENNDKGITRFLYPSSEFAYKNHKLILEAINEDLIYENFQVYFTVSEEYKKKLIKNHQFRELLDKKIIAIGYTKRIELLELMKKSIVIFPSLIECFPTPLAEAVNIGSPIFAINEPYAIEFLESYDNFEFFSNEIELRNLMYQSTINNSIRYSKNLSSNVEKYPSILDLLKGEVN